MPRRSQDRQEVVLWTVVCLAVVGAGLWKLKADRGHGKQPSWAESARHFLSRSATEETQVTGLRNLGNTCFMNAVLQALGSSIYMLDIVSRGADKLRLDVALNATPEHKSSLDFLQKMYALLAGQTNDPSTVHQALTNRVAAFQGFNQQDAHEFLLFVLDMMSDALGIKQAPPSLDLSDLVREPSESLADDVCLPCTGLTSSSLVCNMCHSASPTRLASFNVLSLSIPASASANLESCLRSFSQAESVDGVICAVCSVQDTLQAVREKKMRVDKKPPSKLQKAQSEMFRNLEKAYLQKLRNVHVENLRYPDAERRPPDLGSTIILKSEASVDNGKIDLSDLDPMFDVEAAMSQAKLKPIEARRTFSKRLSFARTPLLLCLQIQRLFGEVKNNRFVPFPLKLDLSAFGSSAQMHSEAQSCSCKSCSTNILRGVTEQKDVKAYLLRAVVVHLGMSNSGHFITYRRMKRAGSLGTTWYYVSDEQVRACDVSEVLAAEAYLLFYETESNS